MDAIEADSVRACDACLRRSWLLSAAAGHLDTERQRIGEVLGLSDGELIAAVGGSRRGRLRHELDAFDPRRARERIIGAGLSAVCRCEAGYPARLLDLPSPPAVIHVAGSLHALESVSTHDSVAIVGSRRASSYGVDVARSLGRAVAVAGIPVLSGMALGIDCAAHEGALSAGGLTLAVLAGEPQHAYPASAAPLHRRIVVTGAAVSELPPGTVTRRWMFPARNRIIAALASLTLVVEAGIRSGALLTAAAAHALGRPVAAVPGRVTSPLAAGCHALLRDGARLVQGPEDVLEALFGTAPASAPDTRPALDDTHRALLEAIAGGADTADALARAGVAPADGLMGVAWLEVAGYVRREAGGRWSVLL